MKDRREVALRVEEEVEREAPRLRHGRLWWTWRRFLLLVMRGTSWHARLYWLHRRVLDVYDRRYEPWLYRKRQEDPRRLAV